MIKKDEFLRESKTRKILIICYTRLSKEDRNKSKKELESTIINMRKDAVSFAVQNNCNMLGDPEPISRTRKEDRRFFEDLYISGSDWNRKALNRGIDFALKNKIDFILVKNSKRFCRNSGFFREKISLLKINNVGVYSLEKNNFLDDTELGDRIMSVVDEQAIFDGRDESQKLFERKKKEMLPSIRPPFGYKFNKKGGNWVKNKDAEKVKILFELYSKKPLKDIAVGLGISKSMCYKILRNRRIYEGYIIYYKKIKDDKSNVVRKEKVEYKGNFEAIINQSTSS